MAVVLIVDDERMMREMLRYVLEKEGHAVIEACNGDEAIELLEAGMKPAVILLDWIMPVKGGQEVLDYVRARPQGQGAPVPPVVVMSAWLSRQEWAAVQAEGKVEKPFDIDQLLVTLAPYLGEPSR